MRLRTRWVRAMFIKELREYRRNRSVIVAMGYLALIFLIQPVVVILTVSPSTVATISQAPVLVYLLAIPALTPAMLAAYSVVGERQQGTLEPVLTTPIRGEELLVGKALAALVPSVAVSYVVFALFVAFVEVFRPGVATALIRGPELLAQIVFTPLLAACSIWIGTAISTRTNDIRTAQGLGVLLTIPLAVPSTLVAFRLVPATPGVAVALAAALILVDAVGWRFIALMFDREQLVAGTRS